MTPEQVALYGGALWVGPLFLLGWVLLMWWLREGPITKRGKRRMAAHRARTSEQMRKIRQKGAAEEAEEQPSSGPSGSERDEGMR